MAGDARGERIRVLIVVNTLGVGGAEVQLARTVPEIDSDTFDVQVAFYSKVAEGHPGEMLAGAGVKVAFLDRDRWGRLRYFAKAAAFMRREDFDIVHAWTGTANLYGRVPAILAGMPCILGGLRGRRTADGRNGVVYSITNWRCSGWTVNARDIKEIATRRLRFIRRSPIFVVPNGIDLGDEGRFMRTRKVYYDTLTSGRPVIGTVSRLAPVKNHKLFVEMARHLTEAGFHADYWIIGDGPMQGQVRAAVDRYGLADRVRLLGYRRDVDAALARMDVFVLTSDSEGCPNALLEAMRASLPVVSTHCTSLEDIVEEGVNGYTVPRGDARGLADRVTQIMADPDAKRAMGTESRRIIEQRFAMPVAVRRLQDVYIDCLRRVADRRPGVRAKLRRLGLDRPQAAK